jgi:hypothetical protein
VIEIAVGVAVPIGCGGGVVEVAASVGGCGVNERVVRGTVMGELHPAVKRRTQPRQAHRRRVFLQLIVASFLEESGKRCVKGSERSYFYYARIPGAVQSRKTRPFPSNWTFRLLSSMIDLAAWAAIHI